MFAIRSHFLCSSTVAVTCRRGVRSGRFHGFRSNPPSARNRSDCRCRPTVSGSASRPPLSQSRCTWRSRSVDREPRASYSLRNNSAVDRMPAWNTMLVRLRYFSPTKQKTISEMMIFVYESTWIVTHCQIWIPNEYREQAILLEVVDSWTVPFIATSIEIRRATDGISSCKKIMPKN